MQTAVKIFAVVTTLLIVLLPLIKWQLLSRGFINPKYKDKEVLYQDIAMKTVRVHRWRILFDLSTMYGLQVIALIVPLILVAWLAGTWYFIPFAIAVFCLSYHISTALVRIGYHRRNPWFKMPDDLPK